jgi:RNA polymerase sigma-70 factor (ECF subfamily)
VEDSTLIERFCRGGDLRAAGELLGRYERELYNYLWQMLRHTQDSEDALQETFAKALRALPRYREENHFKSWLFRIGHNEGLNVIRRRKRAGALPEAELELETASAADAQVEVAERASALHEAIGALPDAERQVVVMRLQSEMPFREIAEVVGAPLGTVLARMHAAKRRLKEMLELSLT